MNQSILKLFSFILITSLVFYSCKETCEERGDCPQPMTLSPTASFQIEYSETDFKVVKFSNFSKNATSFSWAFGDDNASSETNPTHTYADAGKYAVVLTASNAEGTTHTQTKTVIITDPNSAIKDLTGDDQKVWKLSRNLADEEYPLIVGPEDRSQIWWSLGGVDPLALRPCMMEEEYIFNSAGQFIYDSKGLVYAEDKIWPDELVGKCVDETNPDNMKNVSGEDLSAWGAGEHTFEFNASEATLILIGNGAHIGLPKVASTAEVTKPEEMIVYKVTKLETDGSIDKMQLETTIEGGYWQFNLVSYDNPADEPALGVAPPTASFTVTVDENTATFNNTSANADSYMWIFGDGATSTEESPMHTFAEDGSYEVALTANNTDGSSTFRETIIIAVNSSFSANTLFGDESKTWKLAPVAGALKVGTGIGNGNFWSSTEEDVTGRACAFDDTFTFTKDGAFEYDAKGDLWGEAYMGVMPEGCLSETDLPANAAAWGSGSHSFEVAEAMGDELATLTVTGTGAFIALPKAFNEGEYGVEKEVPPTTDGSITYQVLQYANNNTSELLVLTIFIRDNVDGSVYWTFTLIAE